MKPENPSKDADAGLLELLQHPEHRVKFSLSAEQWDAFQQAIEAPPHEAERVRALLQSKALWET